MSFIPDVPTPQPQPTPAPASAPAPTSFFDPTPIDPIPVQRNLAVKTKDTNPELAALWANREGGLDTFGNTGTLRESRRAECRIPYID
jgi:hypothetical protein